MDSHRHQHLLETISKQPIEDRTLIFCTIDDFARSLRPATRSPHGLVFYLLQLESDSVLPVTSLQLLFCCYLDHNGYQRPHRAASCGPLLTHLSLAKHERRNLSPPLLPVSCLRLRKHMWLCSDLSQRHCRETFSLCGGEKFHS